MLNSTIIADFNGIDEVTSKIDEWEDIVRQYPQWDAAHEQLISLIVKKADMLDKEWTAIWH